MLGEIQPYVDSPGDLDARELLKLIQVEAGRKRKLKIWTSSRILQQAGVPWWLPEHRGLLHRVDRLLRDLEASGALVRRPEKQTSRNTRAEYAYELGVESDA